MFSLLRPLNHSLPLAIVCPSATSSSQSSQMPLPGPITAFHSVLLLLPTGLYLCTSPVCRWHVHPCFNHMCLSYLLIPSIPWTHLQITGPISQTSSQKLPQGKSLLGPNRMACSCIKGKELIVCSFSRGLDTGRGT